MSRPPGVLVLLLALAGCGGSGAAAAPASPPAAALPSASAGGVRLQVQGFHVFAVEPGDPAAQATATALGVPVSAVGQMHLVLTLTNTGAGPVSVAGDRLTLRLGGHDLPPVTAGALPSAPLPPGSPQETAVGFDVAATSSGGAPALRWTHGGTVVEVPVGDAPELG